MVLADQQEILCREYLIDLNATQVAIWAGWVQRKLCQPYGFWKSDIQNRIAYLKVQRNEQLNIDADYPDAHADLHHY